jgi:hypothetical protein
VTLTVLPVLLTLFFQLAEKFRGTTAARGGL